jgi:hypothetical protein
MAARARRGTKLSGERSDATQGKTKVTTQLTILILALAVACGGAVLWLGTRQKKRRQYRVKPFLTETQEDFFCSLRVVAPDCNIFPNVPVAALLEQTDANGKPGNEKMNELQHKKVDFALYDNSFKLLCVIDLAGHSNDPEQDASFDRYFKSAGIRVLRWDARAKPSVEQIGRYISSLTGSGNGNGTGRSTRLGPETQIVTAPDTIVTMRGIDPRPNIQTGLSVAMLEHLTPQNRIRINHPHVWERLSLFAPDPRELQKYLNSLLIQDRGEERAGFAFDVLRELSDIQVENNRFLAALGNGWQSSVVNI